MGTWTVNGESFELNLTQNLANHWQSNGRRFCWMNMNTGITDENNDTYFESKVVGNDEKSRRCLKDKIKVQDSTGKTIIGNIIHWVHGAAAATPLKNWFIIDPN